MNQQEKIKKTLTDFGRLSTSRVAGIVGMSHEKVLLILQKMWEDKDIVGEVETTATYWRLKEE